VPYKSTRIEFPELYEGAFVELLSPELMPWGAKKRLAKLASLITSNGAEADVRVQVEEKFAEGGAGFDALTDQAGEIVASLVIDLDIRPVGSENSLTMPVSAADLDRVPGLVIERILEAVKAVHVGPTETTLTLPS
jgi:hypothetical protein